MSYPFHGKPFIFTQPDGTKFEVKGWGDQHHAAFETRDGYTVVRDPSTGFYQFAMLSEDMDELEPSGARVDRFDAGALNLDHHVRINAASAKAKGLEAFRLMGSKRRCEQRREQQRNLVRAARLAGGPFLAPPSRGTVGDFVGLCLLIDFSDEPDSIARQEVDDFCNLVGYSGFGNNGSVHDYFHDNSNGRFRYTNIVTEYYRANHPKSHYTNPNIPHGTRARQLIKEALDHLTSQGFDFGQLSVDSGGYVYALNVYYAGPVVNNWSEGLWPHSWSLASEYDLGGGRQAFDYQFTAMGAELELGTFCHENGHMVCDYPDLYDYGNESRGVGAYCLMCTGGPDEKNPTQISAYLKYKSGWSTSLTAITHGASHSLSSQGSEFALLKKNDTEYFIIENRNKTGRDVSLPGAGLAIWHVDELGSNNNEQRTPGQHYELSLEQADNAFELERGLNNGDAEDLFHAPHNDRFADSTGPDSKWWDGAASGLDVFDIEEIGETIQFRTRLHGETDTEVTIRESSNPNRSIPDLNAVGIFDTMTVSDDVTIASIKVTVDITHTYRGDLEVTLHTPSASSVVLHSRHQGGAADNLKRTYDIASLPALGSLVGQSSAGQWSLQVRDLAWLDEGRLKSWELEIAGAPEGHVDLEESPGMKIPDNDPTGIERTLSTNATGAVTGIEVSVDITHSFIRDLIVTLVSPSGTSVDLHERSGGAADDIDMIYTSATVPALSDFAGEPIQGDWKLKVSDHEGADEGKLNRWHLKILR